MADSLILKGVNDVRKHKGTDMLLRNPKRSSGSQFSLKKWWVNGGVSTQYVKASVFDVNVTGGTVKLAVTTSPSSVIRIDLADDGTFSFYGVNGVDYVGLFTADFELIEYYVMPRLAGGNVMTVTPADGASRPSAPDPQPGGRVPAQTTVVVAEPPKTKSKKDCD